MFYIKKTLLYSFLATLLNLWYADVAMNATFLSRQESLSFSAHIPKECRRTVDGVMVAKGYTDGILMCMPRDDRVEGEGNYLSSVYIVKASIIDKHSPWQH